MIGVGAAALLAVGGRFLLSLFGPSAEVLDQATIYLMLSAAGVPAMLAVQAATGLIRGLQDATLPLIVAVCGAVVTIPLTWGLIFGLQLGIAGSAIGTAISQWGVAAVLLLLVVRAARRGGAEIGRGSCRARALQPGRVGSVAGGGGMRRGACRR